ncbi:helix-turn-helix domain-containing protein [Clostridium sp. ZS2-4]|uniref:helix-turn-helix domain-containing protein n=1 Tax=Clostridium sp. ZS2-4 TaxID=2987703 RepID=UPI00227BA683|nr:helix-turn-helix domain-containing protein [Clostridium sp. ZS2-4]MCY6354368.1 helix-turn-helix domain-containing protein [Clostridium sp. ZS2-4]
MASITKKELQEQLEQADRVIDMQQQKEDILNDKGVVSKQEFDGICNELERIQINYKTLKELYEKLNDKLVAYKNGHENFVKQIELNTKNTNSLNTHIDLLEKKCEDLKKDNNTLEVYRNKLEKDNEKLKAENRKLINNETVTVKKHNERGAGRRSNLTEEQMQGIKELHQEGMSYGKIAKEVGLSKAYVYKLINSTFALRKS